MIEGLKPYPKMKDSGATWLGRVPEHWAVVPHRALFTEVIERNRPDADMLSVTINRGVIRQKSLLADSSKKDSSNLDKSGYKFVSPGDIAYNKMRAWQGAIGVSTLEGIISPAYVVQRPRRHLNSHYVHFLLRTPAFAKEAERWSYGITSDMWSLRPEHFKLIYSTVPPSTEQTAIVQFLTHADHRIRRLIRSKQKLATLLEEQKQAIIHRAVTRGLDPNVRLKPSGIDWLGEIPQHWKVQRAASVCKLFSAKGHEQFVDPHGEHICVTARFVSTDGQRYRRCTRNLSPALRGDVLMVMSDLPRGRALARTYLVSDDRSYAVNQRVCILRPYSIEPRFLAYAANRHPELLEHDDGFNQTHLPNGAFKIMRIALPPLEEQVSITSFLEQEVAELRGTSERAANEVRLLGEFRIRLISDVVTGKLDVREVAESLPEHSPQFDEGGNDTDLGDQDDFTDPSEKDAAEVTEVESE